MYVPELIRKTGLRRGLRPKTIKCYNHCVKRFFGQCNKDPRHINKQDIKVYLDSLIAKGAAGNTINVNLNALKFFYEEVLNKRLTVRIRFSKVPKKLPVILSKEEVTNLFDSIENKKHRLMVSLMYSAGLRVNELVRLKLKDLELDQNYGWVRDGKCGKDRLFIIAQKIKPSLIEHLEKENLSAGSYLFKGRNSGHLTTQTVREIIKAARRKANISKRVHPHALRHSFSTHIIDEGNDVISLQVLLGHNSPETTMIYVHSSARRLLNVRSPYDGF